MKNIETEGLACQDIIFIWKPQNTGEIVIQMNG